MTSWVLLLQGINVGGLKRMPMPNLQSLLAGLGLQSARTYIQSGNAVFTSPETERAALGKLIGNAVAEKFRLRHPGFPAHRRGDGARGGREPFSDRAREDPASFSHLPLRPAHT